MSSIVQLKRSALTGKVPGTGSLNLGELALNTYDGKIFFRRSGSTDTIQEVVTTNVVNTGSITITGTLTAESIVGSISASNGVVSGSSQIVGILSSLNSYTASYATTGSNQFTSDQNITGSLRATGTGSFGSLKVNDTLTINHGEAIISGSALVTNDLTILGQVNARQFNISVISSSVLFQSGSTKFGDTSDDTHSFTGSVNVTGSLYLNGIDLSQGNNSGSFSGSFQGDGSGLRGVVSDELPRNGFDYNINDIASINDFNVTSSKYLIDFDIDAMIGTPVGHKTYIANFTGSTKVIPAGDSVRFHVRDVEVARIDENGFSGSINFPAGVVSGSSQLTASYDTRYVVSGSITQTTWDNIASKPSGIVSGSSQLTSSYDSRYSLSGSATSTFIRQIETYTATEGQTIFPTTASVTINNVDVYINGFKLLTSDFNVTNANTITLTTGSSVGEQVEINLYSAFAGTYLTTTDLTSLNTTTASLASSITNLNLLTSSLATTGSNTFRGTQTMSGSILPAIDNTYDLGSATYQWRDIYVSSGSLYIDGTKVLGSTNQELQITTDVGQSIKILEAGSDNIILQSADGDIQLKTSGGGNLLFDPTTGLIDVRGTLQIQDGNKITSSGGNGIVFGNNIVVSGSFESTGNINGINLTTLSSSIATQISTIQTNTGSSNARLTSIENKTGSYATTGSNTFFGTQTFTGSVYIANDLIVQGSSSIQYISASSVSIGTNIINLNTATPSIRYAGLSIIDSGSSGVSASLLWDSQTDDFIFTHRSAGSETLDSSMFIYGPLNTGSLDNIVGILPNRLTKGESSNDHTHHITSSQISDDGITVSIPGNLVVTGSITGSTNFNTLSNKPTIVSGSSQITFSGINSLPTLVSGSSQIDVMSTTNIARLATTGSNIFTGNITIGNTTPGFLTIGASGSYGSIGSGGNGATIYLNGSARGGTTTAASNTIVVATDGEFYITNGAANSNKIVVATNGNTTFSGTITENSSIRYKENVETIKYGLDKVLQMRGVTYDKKDNGVKEMGVIAEEIYEVLPEVVLKNEEGDIDSVSYGRITAVLIEAIKDLKKEIEDLKANR